MAPPKASIDTLHVMHSENSRQINEVKERVEKVEGGQVALLAGVNEVRLTMMRIETMLSTTLKLEPRVDELKETVDQAKGMGTLIALGLGAFEGLTALWAFMHKG